MCYPAAFSLFFRACARVCAATGSEYAKYGPNEPGLGCVLDTLSPVPGCTAADGRVCGWHEPVAHRLCRADVQLCVVRLHTFYLPLSLSLSVLSLFLALSIYCFFGKWFKSLTWGVTPFTFMAFHFHAIRDASHLMHCQDHFHPNGLPSPSIR